MIEQPAASPKQATKPQSILGDLGPRLMSAIVMVVAALGSLFAGGFVFTAFWLAAAVAIHWEWQRMTGGPAEKIRLYGGGLLIALVAGLAGLGAYDSALLLLMGGAVALALYQSGATRFWNAGGIFYAGALVLAVVFLRNSTFLGIESILWLFAIVWGTDIMAYFGGRLIGGPKLCPRISPAKTWSGFIVGISCGALLGLGVLWLRDVPLQPVPFLLLGLFAGALAQGGDLFESFMKRRYGMKDSSRLIPGHGGVMDRLDGFIAAAVLAALIGAQRGGPIAPGNGLFIW